MTAMVVTLLRFGFLALLWIFVLLVIATLRRDIYGVRVTRRDGKSQPVAPVAYAEPKRQKKTASSGSPTSIAVVDGPLVGSTIPLTGATIIVGRSPDCALVLNDSYSSARHARFFLSEGTWFIEDLQSTNGTFVNGNQIDHPIPVNSGDEVRIGHTTFALRR
ncbi:MAG: FHA domain-containing protein [Flaviflexus sp.]|nr:FHA domain-containing protein [Flaviflexus sp.]